MTESAKQEHIQVAAAMRRLRERAGMNRDDAAKILGCTTSKIGDLETGRSKPKLAELEKLLDKYGVTDKERAELIEFTVTTKRRRTDSPYVTSVIPTNILRSADLEAQAVSAFFYSPELIPGPLQTRAYAEANLLGGLDAWPDDAAMRLEHRMERAKILTRTDRPPLRYWCVLGEGALRTNIGGPDVMREQIAHLIDVNKKMPNVVVQILPFGSGGHAFRGFTATLLRFAPPAPDMLIMDSYGRDMVRDEQHEVARAAQDLDLLRVKALEPKDSTALLKRVHRELGKSKPDATEAGRVVHPT
jgi:transcriptional regulator with XRE-family HTH domain